MKIKELCTEERPREKMASKGAGALTNAELLAILIGSGTQKENVLEVANRLLARSEGRLGAIASMTVQDMSETDGIGPGRSAVITAAFELGKRRCLEEPGIDRKPVSGPESIWKIMAPMMKGLLHEELWAIFLNRSNYPVHKTMVSKGGSSATIVDPKIVVKEAISRHASGIVLIHNHPSGNPRPSERDIAETENLKKAANLFDIALVDHLIICDDCYFSFADDGLKYPFSG